MVLLSSKKNQINPTLFFSQKNQKEFLLEVDEEESGVSKVKMYHDFEKIDLNSEIKDISFLIGFEEILISNK